jgi:hypothetical protein
VYRRLSSHQKISIIVTQHMNIKDEKKTSDVALLFSSNDSQKKKFDRKKKGGTQTNPKP